MAKAPTVVTASTVIRGRVSGDEDLDVLGRIHGSIELKGSITLDAAARIDGDVTADHFAIHGIFVGDAQITDTIHLSAASRVIGDLRAPRIIIEEGAQIRGRVDMGDAPAESISTRSPKTAAPRRAPAPAVTNDAPDEDGEPELPAAASAKNVSVKKRS